MCRKKIDGGPPLFTEKRVRDISQGAIQSMVDTRPTNAGGNFQDGVLTVMRMMKEQESEPGHKPFSNVRKGKLMGLCMVTKWCNMPPI